MHAGVFKEAVLWSSEVHLNRRGSYYSMECELDEFSHTWTLNIPTIPHHQLAPQSFWNKEYLLTAVNVIVAMET